MHMISPGSFHPTSDVMSDLNKLYFGFVTLRQIWLSTCVEKDALLSFMYHSDTFYNLLLFIASI